MKTVTLDDAEIHLESLLDEAANGEAFVIARDGKPLVKVVPFEEPSPHVERPEVELAKPMQRLGFARGLFSIPDDFDTMYQDEIEKMFYGEEGFQAGEESADERDVRREAREG